ncbi:MAG: hypothetical protein HY886_01110 [Deltaproteobacteria bacterium]|nr:hypothetical protein [Deltaproteobacteria bacterium]
MKSNDVVRFVKTVLVAASVIMIAGCMAMKHKAVSPMTIQGFSSPESVVMTEDCKRIFVSNMGDKLVHYAKDNDGFITEIGHDGMILNRNYLPKDGHLNSPKGMAIIKDTLYVADVDRVVGFDIKTREKVFDLDLSSEKSGFLNDLEVFNEQTLFLSATDIGKVYMITIGQDADSTSYKAIAHGIKGPNGLYYDKKADKLYVAGFGDGKQGNGELGVVEYKGGEHSYQSLTKPLGYLDGLARFDDDNLIFSDWVSFDKSGVLRVFNLKTGELSTRSLSEEVRGPADFLYVRKHGLMWMPKMLEGKVLVSEVK